MITLTRVRYSNINVLLLSCPQLTLHHVIDPIRVSVFVKLIAGTEKDTRVNGKEPKKAGWVDWVGPPWFVLPFPCSSSLSPLRPLCPPSDSLLSWRHTIHTGPSITRTSSPSRTTYLWTSGRTTSASSRIFSHRMMTYLASDTSMTVPSMVMREVSLPVSLTAFEPRLKWRMSKGIRLYGQHLRLRSLLHGWDDPSR